MFVHRVKCLHTHIMATSCERLREYYECWNGCRGWNGARKRLVFPGYDFWVICCRSSTHWQQMAWKGSPMSMLVHWRPRSSQCNVCNVCLCICICTICMCFCSQAVRERLSLMFWRSCSGYHVVRDVPQDSPELLLKDIYLQLCVIAVCHHTSIRYLEYNDVTSASTLQRMSIKRKNKLL